MKKKLILVFILNIIFILVFLTFFELFISFQEKKKYGWVNFNHIIRPDFTMENIYNIDKFRKTWGLEYKKPPIVIYGCSFAYGQNLKDEETLGYFLSKMTKRPVYNFSIPAKGLQHALYIIKNQKDIEPKPEYIIYVFIQDQIRRMYMPCSLIDDYNFLEYTKNNDNFTEKEPLFKYLKNSVLYNSFIRYIVFPNIRESDRFNLFLLYLHTMKKEIYKKYPNAKFIFVIYDGHYSDDDFINFTDDKIQKIKDANINVIDLDEIFGKKLYKTEYRISSEDKHPNAKAWENIAPEIVNKGKISF